MQETLSDEIGEFSSILRRTHTVATVADTEKVVSRLNPSSGNLPLVSRIELSFPDTSRLDGASLPSKYKEFNDNQTKGIFPHFNDIEVTLLNEELTLKLQAQKDVASKVLYVKKMY